MPPQSLEHLFVATILKAASAIRKHMRHEAESTLSIPQFRILAHIDRHGPKTIGDLASHMGLKITTMSRTIDGLVKRRLLQRHRGAPDRRQVRIQLSAEGRRTIDSLQTHVSQTLKHTFSQRSHKERTHLLRGLHVLETFLSDSHFLE